MIMWNFFLIHWLPTWHAN